MRHKVVGLDAGATYYYRFVAGASASPVGRTRTAPAENAAVAQLKFAFISCQDWSVNHWAGFDELLTQDLDFIVHLGDYIYETVKAGFQTGAVETRTRRSACPTAPSAPMAPSTPPRWLTTAACTATTAAIRACRRCTRAFP